MNEEGNDTNYLHIALQVKLRKSSHRMARQSTDSLRSVG